MAILDTMLGTGAAGSGTKNALKVAAVLGAIALIRRSGGLKGLGEKMKEGGLGNVFGSWVGRGKNEPVEPGQLEKAVSPNILRDLAERLGLPQAQATAHLAEVLPEVVDRATTTGEIVHDDIPDDIADELSDLSRPARA